MARFDEAPFVADAVRLDVDRLAAEGRFLADTVRFAEERLLAGRFAAAERLLAVCLLPAEPFLATERFALRLLSAFRLRFAVLDFPLLFEPPRRAIESSFKRKARSGAC